MALNRSFVFRKELRLEGELGRNTFLYPISGQCYTDIAALDLELQSMERRKKKLEVLKVHKNKITPPTEKYHAYKTRVNGENVKQIVRATEDGLFDALYEFYFGKAVKAPTLQEAITQWIKSREESGAITHLTATHLLDDAEKYIFTHEIASKEITIILKSQLKNYLEELIGDGSEMRKSTYYNVKSIINGGFDFANMIDGIDCIDARRIIVRDSVKKCKVPDNSKLSYKREEAERIIRHILEKYKKYQKLDVYDLAILLCFCLSIRIGELRALVWDDYDKTRRLLTLNAMMITTKEGKVNRKTNRVDYMKGHSRSAVRDLEVSDFAAFVLELLEEINGDKTYILQSKGEYPITTNNFNDRLKKICEELGIRYLSSHKIRFYACSNMYFNNMNEKDIQYYMGHESVEMTRHYDRREKKRLDRDTVNQVFGFQLPADIKS